MDGSAAAFCCQSHLEKKKKKQPSLSEQYSLTKIILWLLEWKGKVSNISPAGLGGKATSWTWHTFRARFSYLDKAPRDVSGNTHFLPGLQQLLKKILTLLQTMYFLSVASRYVTCNKGQFKTVRLESNIRVYIWSRCLNSCYSQWRFTQHQQWSLLCDLADLPADSSLSTHLY